MSTIPIFEVDETTLVFAFRYALGRRSTAPSHMVAELKRHWPRLTDHTQQQIVREIEIAIAHGDAGDPCDVNTWQEVLKLLLHGVEIINRDQ